MFKFCLLFLSFLLIAPAQAQYAGGSGTASDPYQIASAEDLIDLSHKKGHWDKHFIQTANIIFDPDPAQVDWDNDGQPDGSGTSGFKPMYHLGSMGRPDYFFTGSYDGGGHIIRHLYISRQGRFISMFGQPDGATIRRLGLTQAYIEEKRPGSNKVMFTGGLAGLLKNATVEHCYVRGTIKGTNYTGGLAGEIRGTTQISNSYTHCAVSGNTGGVEIAGGMIGRINTFYGTPHISYCYSLGSVQAGLKNAGGFAGYVAGSNSPAITACFWDRQRSGLNSSASGQGKNSAFFADPQNFLSAGYDFINATTNGSQDSWAYRPNVNANAPYLVQVQEKVHTWQGQHSSDPGQSQNWFRAALPGPEDTVVLLQAPHAPALSDQNTTWAALSIDTGATLHLKKASGDTAANLTVTGGIFNDGLLVIEDGAALIQTATGDQNTASGNYQVQNQTTYPNPAAFKYWSSPVSGETFGDVFDNTNINDAYNWTPGSSSQNNWNTIGTSYTFEAGRGVITTPENTQSANITETRTFTGPINNGPITYDAGTLNGGDYILAGNPYPSAIDNAAFVNDNQDLTGTLHYWNHTTFGSNPVSGDYATWNGTGSTSSGNGSKTPSDYTAAMQGFFVEVKDGISQQSIDVTFQNDQRVSDNNSQFFKNQAPEARQRIWLRARHSSGAVNQLLIGLVPGATDGYDRLYDGRKLKGNPHIAFYSILGSRHLAIQGLAPSLKADKIIPLGLDAGQKGVYTIALDSLDHWPGHHLTLIDSALGVITNLRARDYSFAVNQTGPLQNRFYLALSADPFAGVGLSEAGRGELLYFQQGGQLIIDSKHQGSPLKQISLRSTAGRLLLEASPEGYRHQCAVDHLAAGVYFLAVRHQDGTLSRRKVYLR